MNNDVEFIIAQIIGGLATIIFILVTVFKVGRNKILIGNIAINALWAIHYALIKAPSGIISSIIIVLMTIVYYFKGKNKFMSLPIIPILFCIAFLTMQIIFFENIFTIIILLGDIFLTIALWLNKEIYIKLFVLFCGICFFTYNVSLVTIMGIVTQSISIICNSFYIITHFKEFKVSNI